MEYRLFTQIQLDADWYKGMCELHSSIFTSQTPESIQKEMLWRNNYVIMLAFDKEKVVGYKIGYEERKERFYSWLGGVYPEYRGKGIATRLLRMQHEWCKEQGYAVVRTQTKNRWREMLLLNIREGFDVVGTYTDDRGEPKIILEKRM